MIVVADSSPLHDLIFIDPISLLHQLYNEVLVPDAVAGELRAARSPQQVKDWMSRSPLWLKVTPVTAEEITPIANHLDLGERAAIALAERMGADLILIDEADGRAEAMRRRLRVTGTLGILRAAAEDELIDVEAVLARLRATNFYVEDGLVNKMFGKWLKS